METPFKVGDVVKSRDGRSARILAVDVAGPWSIAAAVRHPSGSEYLLSYSADGRLHPDGKSAADLMPPKKVWYVNLYPNSFASKYATRKEADAGADADRIACVRFEEGQLDE